MKTLLIVFSQTGNTQKIAECIQEGMNETVDSCEIIPMKEVDKNKLADYDLVGIGCPVFYFKEPFHVSDFMEDLPELRNKQWFVFCTHGAVMGITLHSMTEKLENKGITVIGSYHSYASATVPMYPYPWLTAGHPDDDDLQATRDFGKYIVQVSKAVEKGDHSKIKRPPEVTEDWVEGQAKMFSRDVVLGMIGPFSINEDTCTKCGECQDACPVDGIDIESAPPRIQDPCIGCLRCINICPTCSVEGDFSNFEDILPENFVAYKKALEDAIGRGEFQYRIDPESIDFNDTLQKQRKRECGN